MKKTLLLMGLLLGMNIQLSADNVLTMEEFSIEPGEEEKIIEIGLENDDDISALEFRLWLPEGVSVIDDEEGIYILGVDARLKQKIGRVWYTHSVSANYKQDEGCYHIMVFSLDGKNIVGNTGAILEVGLTASADATPGEKKVRLTNIKMGQTNEDNEVIGFSQDDAEFTCTVVGEAAPVKVTAKSYTIKYGDALPEYEFTSEGADLEGTPDISCEATATSPVGKYPITISKGTVTNDNDTYVNGVLTIEKAPLTVKAGTYTMKQGEALPTFEATYEGFVNDETTEVLTVKPTLTTEATSASEPGEYEVTVSGAKADNYEISYVVGTLTVTQADPVTVTAKSYTIQYGDALPEFEFTSEGAALEGTPELSCEATSSSPVGEYPITISKGSVSNYNDAYVAGVLTIEKAPLTIKAGSYTMKQGQALPTFTATYEGFVNEETEDVLTVKPTLTTTATSTSKPGEYEVTASGAEATNYEISYVPGTLTVELLKGDVTGDGVVNAADVTALANYVIGRGKLVNEPAAYVNEDDKIDIADVAALIELIK